MYNVSAGQMAVQNSHIQSYSLQYLIPNRMDIFYFLVLSIPMLLLNTYSTFPPYLHFPKVPVVPYHLLFLHTCLATIPSHLHSHLCMDSMLFLSPFPHTRGKVFGERKSPTVFSVPPFYACFLAKSMQIIRTWQAGLSSNLFNAGARCKLSLSRYSLSP